METIDTTNKFLVAMGGGGVEIMMPPRGPMTNADALLLAAYLVALAEKNEDNFAKTLSAVRNT